MARRNTRLLRRSPQIEILEWTMPIAGSPRLIGGSRAACGTSFMVPELDILLDAGTSINNHFRPRNVFVTHGHNDHSVLLPTLTLGRGPGRGRTNIFCPAPLRPVVERYIMDSHLLSIGDLRAAGVDKNALHLNGDGLFHRLFGRTCRSHGLYIGDRLSLPGSPKIRVLAVSCDHTVPCLGYVFSRVEVRVKAEYAGLSEAECLALACAGAQVHDTTDTPLFAFLGDTAATTLAATPPWLGTPPPLPRPLRPLRPPPPPPSRLPSYRRADTAMCGAPTPTAKSIPVVITECTYLYEMHRTNANASKHTVWPDLEPIVRRWPQTTFVLIHFSLRYHPDEINRFFDRMRERPKNILVWV
ncbi:3'-tRNA processing endoribonuclease [Niveomyces insectorum RCEF 264]|uniref:3'-tRNA processing endoribonuclease n=1 Tax=Niveomyces insectorum RCEF 264 TaxID=1081102 RepID=A0A167VPX0_9HYPO|nr:3'-tRNA processing endoribonuclease [Niveomyces insectorum RCEF 264]